MSPFWITMLIVGLAAACVESYRCGVERGWWLGKRDGRDEAWGAECPNCARLLEALETIAGTDYTGAGARDLKRIARRALRAAEQEEP